MANLWLRLYHDMPNDPKWRTIARASSQPIPLVLSVYLHLLVIASCAVDRGSVEGSNAEDIASALDADSGDVSAVLKAMVGRVLVEEKLSGWDKRQVNREDSSTERVKKYRKTKVKRTVTQSNAHETQSNAEKHNVTADKSREEEIKKEQVPSRGKREEKVSDPRHTPFKLAVETYCKFKGVLFQWGPDAAKQLDLLLKSTPALTLAVFQACLNNKGKSPGIPHGQHPREWLHGVLKYQQGPLNEFNKTGEVNDGKLGNRKANDANTALNRATARVIEEDRAATGTPEGVPGSGGGDGRNTPGLILHRAHGGVP